MTNHSPSAAAVACPRCGAALPVDAASGSVRCTHCGETSARPAEVLAQRRPAMDRIDHAMSQAAAANSAAAELRGTVKTLEQPDHKRGLALAIGINVVLVGGGFALNAAWEWSGLAAVLGPDGGFAIFLILAIVGAALGIAIFTRKKGGASSAPSLAARCATCGAPMVFELGLVVARCPHCANRAIAGPTLASRMVDAAEAHARGADLERARAERSLYRAMSGSNASSVWAVRGVLAWSVLFPSVAIGVWGIAALVEGDPEDLRQAPIALALALGWVVAVAVVGGAIWYVRSRVPAALRARMSALAAQCGGELSEDRIDRILDWLDAHWPGTASAELMARTSSSEKRWALTLVHRGRPVLIVAVLTAFRTQGSIHVLSPAGADDRALHSASRIDARALGFSPGRTAAGVHLTHFGADAEVLDPSTVTRAIEVAIALTARAPDAAMTSTEHQAALEGLLGAHPFSLSDLDANRAGRISLPQRFRLLVQAVLGGGVGVLSLGYSVYVIRDPTMDDRFFGFVLLLVVGIALVAFGGWRMRSAMSAVAALDGPAVPEQSTGHRGGTFYTVVVGEVRFSISQGFYRHLVAGSRYRFYHVAGTHTLLSFEPL